MRPSVDTLAKALPPTTLAFPGKPAKGRRFPVMVIPGGVAEEVCLNIAEGTDT